MGHCVSKRNQLIGRAALLCILAVLLILPRIASAAETETLRVIGSSRIYSENVARARDQAVSNALQTAVQQVTVGLLAAEELVGNYVSVVQAVFISPERFVENFKVLTEASTGKHYSVVVEAAVSLVSLQRTLSTAGALSDEKKMPAVAVVLVEKPLNGSMPPVWLGQDMGEETISGKAVRRALSQKGLVVIDRSDLNDPMTEVVISFAPVIDEQAVLALGKRMGADIVITGRASAQIAANVMEGNLRSFEGTVQLKGYEVDTGEVVAQTQETTIKAHTNKEIAAETVLTAAGQGAGEAMAQRILSRWQDVTGPVQFDLVVEGTRHLANFVRFRRALEEMDTVKKVLTKEMNPDEAILLVDSIGGPKKVAEAVMLQTFDSFGIDIYDVSPNQMKVKLIPR